MRLRVTIAAALALVLVMAGNGASAGAQVPAFPPMQGLERIDYQVELSGPTEVCTGVEYTYTAEVVMYAVYAASGTGNSTSQRWRSVSATITADVAGRGVSGRTRLFGGQSLPARFQEPGTYTITATASGVPVIPGSRIQATVLPATAVIEAKACDFEVSTLSIWYHLPEGFKPWVGGFTDPVRLRPDASGQYVGSAQLSTFAIGTQHGCTATFDMGDPDVEITGFLTTATRFHFELRYAGGTSHTTVTCPGVGTQGRDDAFTLDGLTGDITVPDPGATRVGRRSPHVLHQTSDVNGITLVMLTKLP